MPETIKYATELEYPTVYEDEPATTFTKPAQGSFDVREQVRDEYGYNGWQDGEVGSDPTAGLELRSHTLSASQLKQWYRNAIAELSKYERHEPCGITHGSRASTIGLHLHFSGPGWTRRKAEDLAELSRQPWFKLFACSSITEGPVDSYQVFRDSYCGMRYSDTPSNDAVNRAERGIDHWEWRLLEPVTPDHFDVVIDFMERLREYDIHEARQFARNLVDDRDTVLTAIKRAKAIGIKSKMDMPETDESPLYTIDRSPAGSSGSEAHDFFQTAMNESHAPYIYRATGGGTSYYVMHTANYSSADDPFEINGQEFAHNSVLDTRSLGEVSDQDLRDTLRDEVRSHRSGSSSSGPMAGIRTSDATEELTNRLTSEDQQ
jgi:hypothetical protein